MARHPPPSSSVSGAPVVQSNRIPQQAAIPGSNYDALKQMVAQADAASIKLTLMFSAPWTDFLLDSSHPERAAEFARWKQAGHEIAAHHHSLSHKNWDGYTSLSASDPQVTTQNERYLENMRAFVEKMLALDPGIHSGCANEDPFKGDMPELRYPARKPGRRPAVRAKRLHRGLYGRRRRATVHQPLLRRGPEYTRVASEHDQPCLRIA